MKLLVLSDSHGDEPALRYAVRTELPDHILHLGDCVRDLAAIREFEIPITNVAGNCDPIGSAPEILTPEFEGIRLYMTHGHLHHVKRQYDNAIDNALAEGAKVLLFGHTHIPDCYSNQGLWVLNPGPCQLLGSYGILTLENGQIDCQLKFI